MKLIRCIFLCFIVTLSGCLKDNGPTGNVKVLVTFLDPDAVNVLWTRGTVKVTLYRNGEGVRTLYASTTQPTVVFENVPYGAKNSVRASADLERYYPQSGQTFMSIGRNEIINFEVSEPEVDHTILLKKVP